MKHVVVHTVRALVVICCVLNPVSARSSQVWVELENFIASHDIASDPIVWADGSACTGGAMLFGLDVANEWTEYEVSIDGFGTWNAVMSVRGNLGAQYAFLLSFTGLVSGAVATTAVRYTGMGYG